VLNVLRPGNIRVTVSEKQIEGLEIAVGDKVTLDLAFAVKGLKKVEP